MRIKEASVCHSLTHWTHVVIKLTLKLTPKKKKSNLPRSFVVQVLLYPLSQLEERLSPAVAVEFVRYAALNRNSFDFEKLMKAIINHCVFISMRPENRGGSVFEKKFADFEFLKTFY